MLLKAEVSFQVPGGMWRKEAVFEEPGDFPEAAALTEPNRTLYKRTMLERRLVDLRFFGGNLTAEQYQGYVDNLQKLAEMYAGLTDGS